MREKKNGSRERREDLVWIPIEKHFFTLFTKKKKLSFTKGASV